MAGPLKLLNRGEWASEAVQFEMNDIEYQEFITSLDFRRQRYIILATIDGNHTTAKYLLIEGNKVLIYLNNEAESVTGFPRPRLRQADKPVETVTSLGEKR